jgi:hypothetical protein
MATKTMIHKGIQPVTHPAKVELVEVPDPDNPGEVKLVEEVTEEEYVEDVKLPPGTRFGDYLVRQPYEISDEDTQKRLKARGFEVVSKGDAKKLDAKLEKAEAGSPEAINAAAAERDRKRALVNRAEFDPNSGVSREEIDRLKAEIDETDNSKKKGAK